VAVNLLRATLIGIWAIGVIYLTHIQCLDIYSSKFELPNDLLCVLYLYYDNWDGIKNAKWDTLLKLDK
jgi:hypothetical protein